MTTNSQAKTNTYCGTCGGLTCYPGNCRYNGGQGAELSATVQTRYLSSVTSTGRKVHAVADLTATDVAEAMCGRVVAIHPGVNFADHLSVNRCSACDKATIA